MGEASLRKLQTGSIYSRNQDRDEETPFSVSRPLSTLQLNPTAPREVVHIDSQGRPTMQLVTKHFLVSTLDVPYRDLRMLDHWVPTPYPTTFFIREKALIVNMESVKMIICMDQVYVVTVRHRNEENEIVEQPNLRLPFIKKLCHMLGCRNQSPEDDQQFSDTRLAIDWHLPYELRAFESALSEGIKLQETRVDELENMAVAALEQFTSKVTGHQLEAVKEVKRMMNILIHKVSRIKKSLEKLLDDDLDMMDMYLARRAEREATTTVSEKGTDLGLLSSTPMSHGNNCGAQSKNSKLNQEWESRFSGSNLCAMDQSSLLGTDPDIVRTPRGAQDDKLDGSRGKPHTLNLGIHLPKREPSFSDVALTPHAAAQEKNLAIYKFLSGKFSASNDGAATQPDWESAPSRLKFAKVHDGRTMSKTITHVNPREVEGIEALLEANLMLVEYTLSRLLQIKEQIDDTEDLVVIDLDRRRNELHGLELLLTAITLSFAFVSMIAGVFGMNLQSGWEARQDSFALVTWLSIGTGGLIFLGLVAFLRFRRLMFIPNTSALQASTPLLTTKSNQHLLE